LIFANESVPSRNENKTLLSPVKRDRLTLAHTAGSLAALPPAPHGLLGGHSQPSLRSSPSAHESKSYAFSTFNKVRVECATSGNSLLKYNLLCLLPVVKLPPRSPFIVYIAVRTTTCEMWSTRILVA